MLKKVELLLCLFTTVGDQFIVPAVAKYPLPQRWQMLRKKNLEASDWFTAYNRGKVFNLR